MVARSPASNLCDLGNNGCLNLNTVGYVNSPLIPRLEERLSLHRARVGWGDVFLYMFNTILAEVFCCNEASRSQPSCRLTFKPKHGTIKAAQVQRDQFSQSGGRAAVKEGIKDGLFFLILSCQQPATPRDDQQTLKPGTRRWPVCASDLLGQRNLSSGHHYSVMAGHW